MSNLRQILEQEALAEVNDILSAADSKADLLIREAKTKASERVEAYQKKTEAEFHAATQRAKSVNDLTVSIARIQARDEAIALLKKKVLAAFEEKATQPAFRDTLEALAEEAIKAVEGAEVVIVHPDDRDRMGDWAKQKGLGLRTDPGVRLGIRIVAGGGRRSVENSLPERLQRGWEALVSGVAKRFWANPA